MKFGLCLPNFPFGVHPSRDVIIEVAREAERLGYNSIWATDHIVAPKDKPRFGYLYESLSTLAYLGGATKNISLGTSILVLPYRNAITVAKQTATIDALTNGRLILGVGVGWLQEEFQTLGVDFHRRGKLLDEGLSVLRTLWTHQDPHLETDNYHLANMIFEPRPVHPNGIPIWVGGNSDAALRRAAQYGDAWHADDLLPDQLATSIHKLKSLSNGRAVALTLRRTVDLRPAIEMATRGDTISRWPGAGDIALTGSLTTITTEISKLADLGLKHFVCQFEHENQKEHLDQMRLFAQEIFPRFQGQS